eukprot:1147495-Lingulodinium_polyedra.AAC.1
MAGGAGVPPSPEVPPGTQPPPGAPVLTDAVMGSDSAPFRHIVLRMREEGEVRLTVLRPSGCCAA